MKTTKKYSKISKSQYITGIQCPKALWFYRHRPDLKPEVSEAQQHIFDTGHEIGELAQEYFPSGIEITEEYYEIDKAIKSTEEAVSKGEKFIFEATACSPDGAYSRIDIFKKVKGSDAWDLIEVKASTGVKDYQVHDIAFQRYAFVNAGYKIRKSILMHVNNQYVRSGELNVDELFNLEDCTDLMNDLLPGIKGELRNLIQILKKNQEPSIEIGDHCHDPFDCDYIHHCWQHVPEYSVYNISRGQKRDALLIDDIVEVADIPDNFETTERQRVDILAYKNNQIHVDIEEIKDFLDALVYPLYYLDYETIFPAVPLFNNSRPYQQIPFQFSLHIQKKKGGDLKHVEFLHTDTSDPRPGFIQSLVQNCGEIGSVVVYNRSFESGINEQLAAVFPKYRDSLIGINNRMVDLLIPFRSRWLYHPDMKGSASLKAVLPAFVPELSYDNLSINDGGAASRIYLSCIKETVSEAEKKKIYQDLREYCGQDTFAEVKLLDVLYETK
ncbi:DUF2779 domain-containing protein [Thermodesulfobacteriota bacterium]